MINHDPKLQIYSIMLKQHTSINKKKSENIIMIPIQLELFIFNIKLNLKYQQYLSWSHKQSLYLLYVGQISKNQ